jgi:hypothetical protein
VDLWGCSIIVNLWGCSHVASHPVTGPVNQLTSLAVCEGQGAGVGDLPLCEYVQQHSLVPLVQCMVLVVQTALQHPMHVTYLLLVPYGH